MFERTRVHEQRVSSVRGMASEWTYQKLYSKHKRLSSEVSQAGLGFESIGLASEFRPKQDVTRR
jgi:hypothetical protein